MVLVRSMAFCHGRTFQGVEKVINGDSISGCALLTAMVILVGVITGVIAIGLVGIVMDMTIHGKVLLFVSVECVYFAAVTWNRATI
nr:MAG TPA: hypothetical protein [Caudoviricetes sp.]